MDRRFDNGTVRLQESKKPTRVTHPVQIQEILVSPVVTKKHAFVEPVVSEIPLIPSGIIVKINSFDKSDVHNLVIEIVHQNLCGMILGRGRGVGEDDVLFTHGSGTSHLDKSISPKECEKKIEQ